MTDEFLNEEIKTFFSTKLVKLVSLKNIDMGGGLRDSVSGRAFDLHIASLN